MTNANKDLQPDNLKEITAPKPRPLPVIIIADVSGSMSTNGKIDALNDAVSEMLTVFAAEDRSLAEIQVAIVTFGGEDARLHQPIMPAVNCQWRPMAAAGRTPLGAALDVVTGVVEDPAQVPRRAYRPTLVLVSDGQPTDTWEPALERLLGSDRASKAGRFAMAIGEDADMEMLSRFLANPEARVFQAHEARQIMGFFRWITMSVTARSRSVDPNSVVRIEPTALEDFDF